MDETLELILKEIEEDKLLEHDFVIKYIECFLKKYKLNNYCHNISFIKGNELKGETFVAGYDPGLKEIFLNNDYIIGSIIATTYLKDKESFDREDIKFIYAMYLYYLTHELCHVRQNKMIKTFKNDVLSEMIRDSFIAIDKYYDFYKKNHGLFISEYNADVESGLLIGNLFGNQKVFEDSNLLNNFNKMVATKIVNSYTFNGKEVSYCPARSFYDQFVEKRKYLDFEKRASSLNYNRVCAGLMISSKLFRTLHTLSTGEKTTSNIKKLIYKSGNVN